MVRALPAARPRSLVVAAAFGLAASITGASVWLGLSAAGFAWAPAESHAVASPPSSADGALAPASRSIEPAPQSVEPAPLDVQIDALIDEASFAGEEGVQIGISVVDLETHTTLFAREADTPLNPASNVKLVTTAAALSILGPEHRYSTRVWADRDALHDDVVEGKLYLQGGADPSLVTGEVYELAGKLEAAGIKRVRGPIVVDTSRFDHDGLPPGFDQKDEFASHRAPGGAMSVNYNTYEVHARPAKAAGEPPRLAVIPPVSTIEIDNQALTVAGKRNKLWASTKERKGKTIVTFHGEIGVEATPGSYRYPVRDPSRYAGELLELSLEQRGIKVNKGAVKTGEVPDDAQLLATVRSETLSELCRSVNKWSNNFMAEQILRTLAPGKGATAEAALEALREYTRTIGMPQAGLVLGNGSGLYDNNMISPAALTHLLGHVYGDFRIRSDFLASLAIMGTDGTTRSRLHDSAAQGWIRVKTGTLDEVSALSGYAGAAGRHPIAFSILVNGIERKHRPHARKLQDAIAEAIAAEAARTHPGD